MTTNLKVTIQHRSCEIITVSWPFSRFTKPDLLHTTDLEDYFQGHILFCCCFCLFILWLPSWRIKIYIYNSQTADSTSQLADTGDMFNCLFLGQGWGRANEHFPSLLCISGIIYPLGFTVFWTPSNSSSIWRRYFLFKSAFTDCWHFKYI